MPSVKVLDDTKDGESNDSDIGGGDDSDSDDADSNSDASTDDESTESSESTDTTTTTEQTSVEPTSASLDTTESTKVIGRLTTMSAGGLKPVTDSVSPVTTGGCGLEFFLFRTHTTYRVTSSTL